MEVAEAVWIRLAGVVSVLLPRQVKASCLIVTKPIVRRLICILISYVFVFGNRFGLDLHDWRLSIRNMLLKHSIQLLFYDMEKSHVLGPLCHH